MPKPLPTENKAASSVLDKYVVHPCNELSAPGFLEHLPCLFQEVNVQGRYALRWAVQATGFADMTRTNDGDSATKAIEYYGRSLVALEKSLSEKGKKPDDYDLMTMVVLDVFEVCRPEFASGMLGMLTAGCSHFSSLMRVNAERMPRPWPIS